MRRRAARVAVVMGLFALAAAPPAHAAGGDRPTGKVLWQAYPLQPNASATATSRPSSTPAPKAKPTPAAASGGGSGSGSGAWIAIVVVALAAAAGAAVLIMRRRREPATADATKSRPDPAPAVNGNNTPTPRRPEPASAATGDSAPSLRPRRVFARGEAAAPAPSPPPKAPAAEPTADGAASPRRRRLFARAEAAPAPSPPARTPFPRNAERLRAAVDIRLAREWPWPEGSEGLWRCEIGPDPAALSARFRAVVHPPDGEPARVVAVTSAGSAGGDWQSAAPLEQAVNALAAQLEADGWEPVEGAGDPHSRRFCWRREGAPQGHLRETAWSA